MLVCKICGKEFIGRCFGKRYTKLCCSIECEKIKRQKYYLDNLERIKLYRQENKAKIKKCYDQYNKDHKNKSKDWYDKNRMKVLEYRYEYYRIHKTEHLDVCAKYRKTDNGKLIIKRARHKRRRNLGFNPLNNYFENSHAHHINNVDVIYIPKDWHFKGHSILRNRNMEAINTIAFFFLLMQNIDEFLLI